MRARGVCACLTDVSMNPDWMDFLRQRGARTAGGDAACVLDFGDAGRELAALRDAALVCDLGQFALLGFAGADAQTFLQGQLTCDVREATRAAFRPGALCTPKGRALATFRLWQDADGYTMQLPSSLYEPIRKRLSMYVLRSKVTIASRSDAWARFGLAGPQAAAALRTALGIAAADALPSERGIVEHQGISIQGLCGDRYLLLVRPQAAAQTWTRLAQVCVEGGDTAWRAATIAAGEAVLTAATQDQFVPQMLNLDLLGGIGFQKGCYTGQEIVARTQYLGRLKQRLFHARMDTDTPPCAGDALYSADFDGQATGTVIDAAPDPDGGTRLLAVVRTDSAATQTLHCGSIDGPPLSAVTGPAAAAAT